MNMSLPVPTTVAERIERPGREFDPASLAEVWFQQTAVVRIAGAGAAAANPGLPGKLRGALGKALMRGASDDAIAGRPCPWRPACAFDVLFREQARFEGRHGVPKPYVTAVDRAGNDLDLKVTLFGFACDWMDSIRERLVEAARFGLPWRKLLSGNASSDRGTHPEIRGSWIATRESIPAGRAPEVVALQFLTGVDATGCDPLDDPATLIARLARRIDGLARWQDAVVPGHVWEALAPVWKDLHYSVGLREGTHERYSKRQGRIIRNADLVGHIGIEGDLEPVWPLLKLGEQVHIGRGATAGRGRFALRHSDVYL